MQAVVNLLDEMEGHVEVRWIPSHQRDMPFNERADALAKIGASGESESVVGRYSTLTRPEKGRK